MIAYDLDGTQAERVLLVGLGKRDKLETQTLRKALVKAVKTLVETGAGDAVFVMHDLDNDTLNDYWLARHTTEAIKFAFYRYETTKSKKEPTRKLKKVALLTKGKKDESTELGIEHGNAIGNGVALARELANLPGNICTPTYLANQAKKLAKDFPKIKVKVLEEADM